MKSISTGWLAVVLLFGLLWPTVSQATHVRAGAITTRRIPSTNSQLTYEITLTAYFDESNPDSRNAAQATRSVNFCFGDGVTANVDRLTPIQFINNGRSSVNIYRTIHTYPGGEAYKISAVIENRNNNTRNINNGNSINTPFYVATTIFVNASLGLNSTPILLNAPLDSGRVGQRFCYNPAAFDVDGDSLAYRSVRVVPAQATDSNPCQQLDVPGYRFPDAFSTTNEAGGAPTYGVNPITGDLCWDAPNQVGQFNMAFVIEEWRNGVRIGEITVDLQIFIEDSPNRRPLLQVPPELCVEAGTLINQTIRATDPDGNRVTITAFGGPLNRGIDGRPAVPALIAPNPATFTTPNQAQPQPGSGTFSWQTNCNHVRQEPYQITFRVADAPTNRAVSLVSFQTLRITVYGARPQNVTARPSATVGGRAVLLNWTPYTCVPAGISAQPPTERTQIVVYRKEGCNPDPDLPCTTGVPAGQGYVRVGTVPYTTSTFTDTTALRRGVQYSYRIVALYPLGTGGGASVASPQLCFSLPSLAPLLTHVTVDSTGPGLTPSVNRGVITVRWTRPLGLNPGDLSGPYQYRLLRAQTGTTAFAPVLTRATTLAPGVADTVFIDQTGLNTVANGYTYQLEFYYTNPAGQLTRLETTDPASSVRLTATPANRRIALSWQATTPWSNDNQTHRVYRSTTGPNGPFNQIAAVAVGGPASYTYTDTGADAVLADGNTGLSALSADSTYCYRVETVGRYADPTPLGGLTNFSQIVCAQPADTTRPCPPTLGVDTLDCASLTPRSGCSQSTYTNNLSWVNGTGPTCDPNIASYNIYYSRYTDEPVSTTIGSVLAPTLTFGHQSLSTVAGCYQVTAVSRRGLESAPSNRVCVESCPYFALPNVFTPNGDGKNDVFVPLACPRFVESVQFVVVNRWGAEVYRTGDVNINWSGRASNGGVLPGGLYYYQATVRFSTLSRNAPAVVYKGWVELIREVGMVAR